MNKQMKGQRSRIPLWAVSLTGAILLCGCGSPPPKYDLNLVYLKVQERNGTLTDQQMQELADVMDGLFGTPDNPSVPAIDGVDSSEILNIEHLKKAAGAVGSDELGRTQGLYRKHCVHCHGITGDGAGPTAAFLNPYPRDYRPSVYKFKTTPQKTPPTHADLMRTLVNGIPGTSMPSFRLLDQDELDALVTYVRYLSIRGTVERELIANYVSFLEPDMHLFDFSLAESDEEFQTQLEEVKTIVSDVMTNWASAQSAVTTVPTPPPGWDAEWSPDKGPSWTVLTKSGKAVSGEKILDTDEKIIIRPAGSQDVEIARDEVEDDGATYSVLTKEALETESAEDRIFSGLKRDGENGAVVIVDGSTGNEHTIPADQIESQGEDTMALYIKHGHELFYGNVANCGQCHGPLALGDGQLTDFDEWTSEWTVKNNPPIDPKKNINAVNEFLALGALRPRNIRPRNLRMGIFRGGRRPVDQYLRIKNGIAGTPMPAASDKLENAELWAIVAYLRSLQYQDLSRPSIPVAYK